MKISSRVPVLCRHSFFILKRGMFLVITMLCATLLRYNLLTDTQKLLRLSEARLMISESLLTLTLVVGTALLWDIMYKKDFT